MPLKVEKVLLPKIWPPGWMVVPVLLPATVRSVNVVLSCEIHATYCGTINIRTSG